MAPDIGLVEGLLRLGLAAVLAGAIIRHGINVRGLTTAASLWVVAAIGVAVGAGMYAFSVATTALVLLALWPLAQLKHFLQAKQETTRRVGVTLESGGSVSSVLAAVEQREYEVTSVEVREEEGARRVDVLIVTQADDTLGGLLDTIAEAEGVQRVEASD